MDTQRLETAMRRALELAALSPALGANPQVGCVILSPTGETLAEGWHRGAGTPHAEVDALSKLAAGAARGATAVVTLEPCNHTGHTGPCAEALIEAGVARVAFSVSDPNPIAQGGADRLRAAGVEVIAGILSAEGAALQRPWLIAAGRGRPFVTAKWASSLDGRAAAADGTSQWITGPEARAVVHERRAAADAILVGTGTVLADDPQLTARTPEGGLYEHQPLPVVIGTREVPAASALHRHPAGLRETHGATPAAVLESLYTDGVRRVFVEGGPTLMASMAADGLIDEFVIHLGPMLLGGPGMAIGELGVTTMAEAKKLTIRSLRRLGDTIEVVAEPERHGA